MTRDDYSLFKDQEVRAMNEDHRESKRQRAEEHGYYD